MTHYFISFRCYMLDFVYLHRKNDIFSTKFTIS